MSSIAYVLQHILALYMVYTNVCYATNLGSRYRKATRNVVALSEMLAELTKRQRTKTVAAQAEKRHEPFKFVLKMMTRKRFSDRATTFRVAFR